jgi:hypothetical protein
MTLGSDSTSKTQQPGKRGDARKLKGGLLINNALPPLLRDVQSFLREICTEGVSEHDPESLLVRLSIQFREVVS